MLCCAMNKRIQMKLAEAHVGRIIVHVAMMARDGTVGYHVLHMVESDALFRLFNAK